jgi:hypothetical protein
MDDSEKLEMLRRAKEFIQNSADLSDDIKEKMLRVVNYVLDNPGIQQQLFDKNRLFQDNENDKNPVSLSFTGRVIELNINYYDAKQYRILIKQNGNYDELETYTSDSRRFRPPSKARELYSDQTITLPQVEETVIDVETEVAEENLPPPTTKPAPPSSTTAETQPEQNAELEKLKKSLAALRSASQSQKNDENLLPAHKKSKETIQDTVSAVLQNDQQLAQLLDKSKLLIYKDEKSRQPVLLSYSKHTDNVSAIVYNHSGDDRNYFFRKNRGTFTGIPTSAGRNNKSDSTASLDYVEKQDYPQWVILKAEQRQQSNPSTPKAEPEPKTGTGTGTGTGTEEVPQQLSPPSEEKNEGQDDQQSKEPENKIEGEPPSTPQPQATLKSNLEALLKKAESSKEEDHYQRLAAAIEFIQSNPDAMQKLADGEKSAVLQKLTGETSILVAINKTDKNPVRFSWNGEKLLSTVYYPKYKKNRFIIVNDNKIEHARKVSHSNAAPALHKLTPDKIIMKIDSDKIFYRPEGQQSAQQQQTQSSQPVAQTIKNIFKTSKTKVSSLDDNTKKLGVVA